MTGIAANPIDLIDFLIRLVSAIVCGFMVGLERQWINRVAGIQTNVLVCTGSCVFILGSYFVSYEGQSASRIAAQVVSGIGFLGAGMIFRDGINTHGINTAATIWCSAAVGVLCGMGLIPQAFIVVAFLILANLIFRKIDHTVSKNRKWTDLRVSKHYEIEIIGSKEKYRDLRKQVLNLVTIDDHHVYSVKTSFIEQNLVKISLRFHTHHLDSQRVQTICENIENIQEDLIIDWSQVKANK